MKAVRQTDTADSDDPSYADESEFFVGAIHHHDKLPIDDVWRQNLYVHGQTVSFLLDTGSEVNIMPMAIYRSLHVRQVSAAIAYSTVRILRWKSHTSRPDPITVPD